MPIVLRSQARSVQYTGLVSSPGANTPRFIPGNNSPRLSYDSRQGNAVVTEPIYDGAPFDEVANGNHEMEFDSINSTNNFSIKKCGDKRCKTCLNLIISKSYYSNHANKKEYNVINHTGENLSCKSQNVVYLLTCKSCNIQYVGETTQPVKNLAMIFRRS